MEILQISKSGRYKYKVLFTMEGQEQSMPLYFSEIRRYHITEGETLEDSVFDIICREILYKRALERAEYLLDRKAYTTSELHRKLTDGDYPDCVADRTVEKLMEYHFLDDESYVRNYIEYKSSRKSIRQMKMELVSKGIDKETVEKVLCEQETTDIKALKALAEKRCKGADLSDPKEKAKHIRYLLGKGFDYDDVVRAVNNQKNVENSWDMC